MKKRFAFIEEDGGAAEMVSRFQGGAEISNTLLGYGVF